MECSLVSADEIWCFFFCFCFSSLFGQWTRQQQQSQCWSRTSAREQRTVQYNNLELSTKRKRRASEVRTISNNCESFIILSVSLFSVLHLPCARSFCSQKKNYMFVSFTCKTPSCIWHKMSCKTTTRHPFRPIKFRKSFFSFLFCGRCRVRADGLNSIFCQKQEKLFWLLNSDIRFCFSFMLFASSTLSLSWTSSQSFISFWRAQKPVSLHHIPNIDDDDDGLFLLALYTRMAITMFVRWMQFIIIVVRSPHSPSQARPDSCSWCVVYTLYTQSLTHTRARDRISLYENQQIRFEKSWPPLYAHNDRDDCVCVSCVLFLCHVLRIRYTLERLWTTTMMMILMIIRDDSDEENKKERKRERRSMLEWNAFSLECERSNVDRCSFRRSHICRNWPTDMLASDIETGCVSRMPQPNGENSFWFLGTMQPEWFWPSFLLWHDDSTYRRIDADAMRVPYRNRCKVQSVSSGKRTRRNRNELECSEFFFLFLSFVRSIGLLLFLSLSACVLFEFRVERQSVLRYAAAFLTSATAWFRTTPPSTDRQHEIRWGMQRLNMYIYRRDIHVFGLDFCVSRNERAS